MRITVPDAGAAVAQAAAAGYNLRRLDGQTVTVALDETTELYDVDALLRALNGGKDAGFSAASLAEEVRGGTWFVEFAIRQDHRRAAFAAMFHRSAGPRLIWADMTCFCNCQAWEM